MARSASSRSDSLTHTLFHELIALTSTDKYGDDDNGVDLGTRCGAHGSHGPAQGGARDGKEMDEGNPTQRIRRACSRSAVKQKSKLRKL